ncbi:hypothetical protein N0V90_010154 [Kalmusia sp. IMI 367209]|nr:hypothetical protein N0V90_010154 [Kalmusia sp. IMI 367209]
MPGSLDHIFQACGGRNGTELSACFTGVLGGSNSIRGVDEVWIRSFGVHVAALASFGHLMSLQGSVNWFPALVTLLCHFEFPEIALAQMMIRTFTMAVRYAGSAAIWIRMVFHVQDRSYWFWHIDLRTFEVVVGGLFATINSILIHMIGGRWEMMDAIEDGARSGRAEISETSSCASSSENGDLEVQIKRHWLEHSASNEHRKASGSRFAKLQEINSSFSQLLDEFFPDLVQKDLELGILLQRAFIYGMTQVYYVKKIWE